jgi:hypothetical protein
VRVALAALCAAGALLVVPMLGAHPGPGINYRNMLGGAALELGLVGLVVSFLAPTAVGDMGLALSAILYPLTAINLFESAFWPQRTVVYLGLGVALLGAGVAAALVQGILAWKPLRAPRRAAWVAPVATIAAVLLVAGAVNAAPAKTYAWYRLYTNDEFGAIQATSALVDKDPSAHIMVYSWQPGLFLKAAGNPDQVRYCPACYQDAGARSKALAEHGGSTWYVVVDAYTDKDAAKGKADEGWVGGDLVESAGHWRVYRLGGS